MQAEFLIKSEAVNFSKDINRLKREQDGAVKYKDKLTSAILNYYENLDKLIFLYEVAKLIDVEYDEHLLVCEFSEIPEKCSLNRYYQKCKFFSEQEIRKLNPEFDYTILRPNINSNLIKKNIVELKDYPEAAKLFISGLDKLNQSRFERNLLDDLRLSLESLLKQVLKNSKSLENQTEFIGELLKSKGASKELINMFRTLSVHYSTYQNAYIKHNDKVKEEEVDLMVNLTSAFINFIININH